MAVAEGPSAGSPDLPRPSVIPQNTMDISSPSPSSSSSSSCSTACLLLHHKGIRLSLYIPEEHFCFLEGQKACFLLLYETKQSLGSRIALALSFLDFLLTEENIHPAAICAVLHAFESEFLGDDSEIHSLVAGVATSLEERQILLGIYHRAVEASGNGVYPVRQRLSALFRHAKTNEFKLMAVFGGQGDLSRICVEELAGLYTAYKPLLRHLIGLIGPQLRELSSQYEFTIYSKGRPLDLEAWLSNANAIPDSEFISCAPVSVPIIGILSLARYCVACHLMGITPGEMRSLLQGTTGHSQGILVSITIAASESWDSFYRNSQMTVEILFQLGWECHRAAPQSMISPIQIEGIGRDAAPSYMLSVRGLGQSHIEQILKHINASLPHGRQICLALINAYDQFVIAGPVDSLLHVQTYLNSISSREEDQNRIPAGKRKPSILQNFLPISTTFHTHYLSQAAEKLKKQFAGCYLHSRQLAIPVYHTRTGKDIREGDSNVLSTAIDAIASECCDWPCALGAHRPIYRSPVSHIVVFDRGGLGPLVKKVTEGSGVRVIQAGDLNLRDPDMGTLRDLLSPNLLNTSTRLQSWGQAFQPRLTTQGLVKLETRLSQLIGAPPIIVAGMTPTTKHSDFVAAIMCAGYYAELAGGGYHSASEMATAIHDLVRNIPPGRGINCNLIYANPQAMAWQIALLRRLSRSQVPIDGLTIGAGVPSLDVASEYIRTLGLRYISFKPGSVSTIRQVVEIAKAHPDFPIILQWTGGRGGGHHSFEDFHAPILSTYGVIRQQLNIYLVAGSGFGSSDSMYPYLTGAWSASFGHSPMPFDGILLGSRMMVAKEAHTSPEVRKIIDITPGVPDSEWEKTYTGPTGGIITVKSEMGEPIHKIATRGVQLWAEMDKTVFNIPHKDRVPYLMEHRSTIIGRLNSDFAKPWFGCNHHDDVVNLEDMSYIEVLNRIIELMYVHHQGRWIDPSYVDFAMTIATRWVERLSGTADNEGNLSSTILMESPDYFLISFANSCPGAEENQLNPEDVSFFLMECRKPGRKPVNFIPALDEDFEYYFKKDSLWQSEDIDAVIGRDAGRVCILHGPVAAQYCRERNESAKDILDSITGGIISLMQDECYAEDFVSSSDSGVMTPASWSTISLTGRDLFDGISSSSFTSLSDTPDDNSIPSGGVSLASVKMFPAWMRAVLGNKILLQNNMRQKNPFSQFMQHAPNAAIHFDPDRSEIQIDMESQRQGWSRVKIQCSNGVDIIIQVYPTQESIPLKLEYKFSPSATLFGLSENMEQRNKRTNSFYSHIWFEQDVDPSLSVFDMFYGPEVTLTQGFLDELTVTIGSAFSDYRLTVPNSTILPISAGIIIAWEVMSRPLVLPDIDGDILRLLHHSNTFRYCAGENPLELGDTVSSRSRIQAVYPDDAGKIVVVEGQIIRSGEPILIITSTFLFRGPSTNWVSTPAFRHSKEPQWILCIASELDESILLSREWFNLHDHSISLVGKSVTFAIETLTNYGAGGFKNLRITGTAFYQINDIQQQELGTIEFSHDACTGNPVLDFLKRRGKPAESRTEFENKGWAGPCCIDVQMPQGNEAYSRLSKDFNPIHTSPIFASLSGIPQPICHGMYTSAVAERVLELLVLQGNRERLRRFESRFTGMVMPNEKLIMRLKHTGMVEGRMCFRITAVRWENKESVLEVDAEVDQPRTAYMFTGQGSQSKGMGMELYNSSSVVKAVWDEMDQHIYTIYGWSVLDMVRTNPKSLTVHFGGRNGRRIRQKYLSITTEVPLADGTRVQRPALAGLTPNSTSYTFMHPRGLLYSTQFAQPAILVFEAAAFAELRARGYVSQGAIYAGHSLGEFGALSALSQSIPTSGLIELAFYRGLVMQASVAQDNQDGTTYGMVAANPKRMGKYFTQAALSSLVRIVASESQELLEIVNYNVNGEQYVCSGTTANLHVLGILIDHITQAPNAPDLIQEILDAVDTTKTKVHMIIRNFITEVNALPRPIQLQRGKATIPLEGIDVPFHSSHLRGTVEMFRQCLLRPGFLVDNINAEQLVGKYIPNLMAKPFSLDEAYIREAFEITKSPVLAEILGV